MYYVISAVLNLLTSFGIGTLVFLKNRKSPVNKAFVLFTLSVSFWSFGYIIWQLSQSYGQALFWIRFAMVGSILISPSFTDFIIQFVGVPRKYYVFRVLNWSLALAIILFSYTKWFIKTVEPVHIFQYWPVPGFIFFVFHLFFIFNSLFCWWLLFNKLGLGTTDSKVKESYVLVASCIGFIGGMTNHLLWYKILVPPFGNIGVAIGIVITAYAITRYHLMDIEVFIKKPLVFAGTFVFAFSVFVAVTLSVSQLIGGGRIISLAISSIIIIIGLRPLETWLVNVTDKFLFQKKYEYKQILKKFIDDVITVLNLDEVVASTLKLLDESLHPYAASIFILNRVDDKYTLYGSYGLENKDIIFTSESRLVYFLKKTHNPAVIKQVDGIKGVDSPISLEMDSLKAVLVLPFLLHDDLIGFIALGRKKSDEDYTKDDLDVLLDLARTESIAVGNAQLLTEAAQAERRAAIGTMAAGINHEIGNPLNIMSTKIQLFKMARQKGLLKDKPVEEALDQAEAALDECLKQSVRISGVAKKLSNFAKPSKEFKPQLLSLTEEINETLAVVGYDIELGKIQIVKKFAADLFKVLADKQEVQQVFFNIIRNAAQAIDGAGMITLSLFNSGSNKVRVEIQDTGKGIPEDKIHRVFEPFFTTKGPSKGTGLGLSIVRQLVWRNKGEISFKSQAGEGTTFILEFPKGE